MGKLLSDVTTCETVNNLTHKKDDSPNPSIQEKSFDAIMDPSTAIAITVAATDRQRTGAVDFETA